MYSHSHSILGLIILILDVWAILNILNSPRDLMTKLMWSVLILILPVIGFIIWYLLGPKGSGAKL